MNLLEIKNLNKYYHKGKDNELHVLKNLNFQLRTDSMTAIIGQSGCGKSTLLNIIGCLDDYDSGNVIFNNQSLEDLTDKSTSKIRSEDIGFVLQNFALIEEESVISNITTPLYFNPNIKLKNFRKLGTEILEELGILTLIDKRVSELSGGQKQRVAIARAMITKPLLLLADEPTGSLDKKTSVEIMNVLKKLNDQGTAIVIVTHDLEIANECKQIVRMTDGIFKSDKKQSNKLSL